MTLPSFPRKIQLNPFLVGYCELTNHDTLVAVQKFELYLH